MLVNNSRQYVSLLRRKAMCRLGRFHQDESGQLLVISAVFTLVIVMLLTVTVNLSYVTHRKMQAQTAADAAALSAGIWQVRGLSFVQSMNNAIVYADAVAYGGLIAATVLNTTAHADPTGVSIRIGNVALGITIGGHAISQFVLIPFRYLYSEAIGPIACYVSASEMAKANGATPVFSGLVDFGGTLATNYILNLSNQVIGVDLDDVREELPFEELPEEDDIVSIIEDKILDSAAAAAETVVGSIQAPLVELLDNINIYALNTDIVTSIVGSGELKFLSLDLNNGEATADNLPLFIDDKVLDKMLQYCYALQPVQAYAIKYFHLVDVAAKKIDEVLKQIEADLEKEGEEDQISQILSEALVKLPLPRAKWRHDYLESPSEGDGTWKVPAPGSAVLVKLGPSTWLTTVRVGDRYGQQTSSWASTGGLGLRKRDESGNIIYGELPAVAMSSVRVFADRVVWFNPIGDLRGWVELVPVPSEAVSGIPVVGTSSGGQNAILH